jgi:homoserine kinase
MTGKASHRRASSWFEVVLPATSANLGPAFDAAALALSLFLKVRARAANQFSIIARGRDAEICGQLDQHLILTTYREVMLAEGKAVQPLALNIQNLVGCGAPGGDCLSGTFWQIKLGG